MEVGVVGGGGGEVAQGEDAAEEDDGRSERDSPAEHVGDGGVELFVGQGFHLDLSGEAVEDHLEAKCDDDDAEEDAQSARGRVDEDARAEQGAGEDAEHDGHGDAGIDVAAVEVDVRRWRRR